MKNHIQSLIVMLGMSLGIAGNAVAATTETNKQPSFATFNQKYYKDGQLVDKYLGDLVAVTGKITDKKPGPQGRALVQIKLDGINKTIWIGTIIKPLEDQLNIGETIDVLGFFDETEKEPQYIAKVSKDKEYLIGFCFNVHQSGLPLFFNRWMSRCLSWENGEPFEENTIFGDAANSEKKQPKTYEAKQPAK